MTVYVLSGVRKSGTLHAVRFIDEDLGYYTLCGRPAKHPQWHVGRSRIEAVTCKVCAKALDREARSAA